MIHADDIMWTLIIACIAVWTYAALTITGASAL